MQPGGSSPAGLSEPIKYSEKRHRDELWTHPELVQARNLACAGAPVDEIAEAVGHSAESTRHKLDTERRPRRVPSVTLGYADIKACYR